jgi:hypothetical protein
MTELMRDKKNLQHYMMPLFKMPTVYMTVLIGTIISLKLTASASAKDILTLTQGLTLGMELVDENRIQIQILLNKKAWVGFGISQGNVVSMNGHGKGSEVYICSDGMVKRHWITGYNLDAGTTVGGETICKQEKGRTELTFTRPLKTSGVTKGLNITPSEYQPIIYAHGDDNVLTVGFHGDNKGGTNIKFASSEPPKKPTKLHAKAALWANIILMVVSWGFLLPFGVFIANMTRSINNVKKNSWFIAHRTIQYIGWALQLLGFIAAVVYCQLYSAHFTVLHTWIGLAVVVVGTLQPLNAYCRPHAAAAPNETKSGARQCWEFMHKGFGYVAIFGGIFNVVLGILLVKQDGYVSTVSGISLSLFIINMSIVVIWCLVTLFFPDNVFTKCCLRFFTCELFYVSNSEDEEKLLDVKTGRTYSSTTPSSPA